MCTRCILLPDLFIWIYHGVSDSLIAVPRNNALIYILPILSCGIFQTHYELVLLKDHSSSSIAWITTIQIFLMYVLGGVIGILVDAFGPRKIIITSSLISVFGLCMLSLSTKYWQVLLSQGVVYGMGAAGLFLPGIVTTGQWFTTKRGLAIGLVASGSSVGTLSVSKQDIKKWKHQWLTWVNIEQGV